MKRAFSFSLLLNVLLCGSLAFVFVHHEQPVLSPAAPEARPAQAVVVSAPLTQDAIKSQPFRWSQLDSGNDYRAFVANLRAIGCPENTIEDIINGNVGRAFAWERSRLKIDGADNGSWSKISEQEMVNGLLGKSSGVESPVPGQNVENRTPTGITQPALSQSNDGGLISPNVEVVNASSQSPNGQIAEYPWGGRGISGNAPGNQSLTVSQMQPGDVNSQKQNANGPLYVNETPSTPDLSAPSAAQPSQPSQTAQSTQPISNDPYAMGAQDYANIQLADYYNWYKSQIAAANASGGNLIINPAAAPGQ